MNENQTFDFSDFLDEEPTWPDEPTRPKIPSGWCYFCGPHHRAQAYTNEGHPICANCSVSGVPGR